MSAPPPPIRAEIVVRRPAHFRHLPWLALPLIHAPGEKPRGVRRWTRKAGRLAHEVLGRRLGLSGRGELVLDLPPGERSFLADFRNTAYIDYASRTLSGTYEPEVTALLDLCSGGAEVVYDIGANWGYFVSVLVSNPNFTGRIHAFEIAPRTFLDLSTLVGACGLADRVTCHPFGLSDADGTVAIEEGRHSFLTRVSADPGRGTKVPVSRLDDLDLPDPDIVKVDVEGHEAAVFRGGREMLARARPLVVFESWFDSANPDAMDEPMAVLSALGYGFYRPVWALSPEGVMAFTATCPDGRPGRRNSLALVEMTPATRRAIPEAINVVAIHPHRLKAVARCFAQKPGE